MTGAAGTGRQPGVHHARDLTRGAAAPGGHEGLPGGEQFGAGVVVVEQSGADDLPDPERGP
ncbi:hypothetical protein [Amycolatopsis suaedae]|uniref:hypothetical protein n=1 Tax=Amycolatopsis suaedae TaxID=2510978 RepID=UPI001F116B21|nr:hypothetical protein [Amycolatopsis suaedae]